MQRILEEMRNVNWAAVRHESHKMFAKLIRTKNASDGEQEIPVPGKSRLSRCLTTVDLTSLGVGSCVGTGMYLVAGMVARNFAGPGVIFSFIIAAVASIFSGACYAEFGVRVPNTSGSAYSYSYVAVGEFVAFIIGWNMVLEYLIGTSACARALSACVDSLCNGQINNAVANNVGTVFGKPPDFLACSITLMMMVVLMAGVRKSLFLNNLLNAINLIVWVFIMGAGLFYIDFSNWTEKGFLPFGWAGVFSGAATCFYAFIGFDIIATTGAEANNPKRSIPLSIVLSLCIILLAYVSISMMLTLIVPYNEVETDSALVQMFGHVHAPLCKYVVAMGALAGLTVSMFGSMFPMPRIIYAMATDGLIFLQLAAISEAAGTPAFATFCGGTAASFVALLIQLEVLVEMMSIGTLLAYTLVSTCVLILRYQPHSNNLIELLPQSIRTPNQPEGTASGQRETAFAGQSKQHVMVRRFTRSSPDSDDTLPGDESDGDGRDDTFLVQPNPENFYGAVPGGTATNTSRCSRFWDSIYRKLNAMSYLCPGLFPWVEPGPATEESGLFVIKSVGIMYALIITLTMFAAYGNPGTCTLTTVVMVILFLAIVFIQLAISRKPQNRSNLVYATPYLPFVPTVAITVNIYLILNLSILTLVRFTVWMTIGMVMYFRYGIHHSKLETDPPETKPASTPTPTNLDRTTIPPPSPRQNQRQGDRNIFEGDGSNNFFGSAHFPDPLLAWHENDLHVPSGNDRSDTLTGNLSSRPVQVHVESRYNTRTNRVSTATVSQACRPPWAYPDPPYGNWDD